MFDSTKYAPIIVIMMKLLFSAAAKITPPNKPNHVSFLLLNGQKTDIVDLEKQPGYNEKRAPFNIQWSVYTALFSFNKWSTILF